MAIQLLERCSAVAITVRRFQFVVWTAISLSVAGFAWLLFAAKTTGNQYILICVVSLIWSLCLLAFSYFPLNIPRPLPEQGFFLRLKLRGKRAFYWLLALAMLLSTLAAFAMSMRLLSFAVKKMI